MSYFLILNSKRGKQNFLTEIKLFAVLIRKFDLENILLSYLSFH